MTGQNPQHRKALLTKLASVNLTVIAVSIAFLSHFATARSLTASPNDSLQFEESPEYSQQAIPPGATAADTLNMTTINPALQQSGVPLPATGVPLSYARPKAPAKKAEAKGENPMEKVMGMMKGMGGGGAGGGGQTAPRSQQSYGTPSEQAATSAGYNPPGVDCPECNRGIRNGQTGKIDAGKAADFSQVDSNPNLSEKEKCWAKYTATEVAEKFLSTKWRNRTQSGGKCARGVRTLLDMAGLKKSGEGLGDAIEYHGRQTLRPLDYRLLAGVSEEKAPPGSILVYGGPSSEAYMAGRTGNDGTGNTLGHVTIKGADGAFYTDGRTQRGAGANRHLVGVYVMSTCLQCKPAVKSLCESGGV